MRDKARNRELFFDDYVLLVFLYLFNPLLDSLRTLQQAAGLPELRQRLGIKSFSLGSFSESCRVFEPQLLQEVIRPLYQDLQPVGRESSLTIRPGSRAASVAIALNKMVQLHQRLIEGDVALHGSVGVG